MKTKFRKALLSLAIALVVVAISLLISRDKRASEGPAYEGRTLGEWLSHIDALSSHLDRESPIFLQASNAIVQIGTEGLPFLIESIRYEPSRTDIVFWSLVGESARRLPYDLVPESVLESTRRSSRPYRAEAAVVAFELLGRAADSCVEDLAAIVRVTTDRRVAGRATHALAVLGGRAYPFLRRIALDTNALARPAAVRGMRWMGTNTAASVPMLVQLLDDPDPYICQSAVGTLGDIRLSPEVAVPALARILQHPNAETRLFAVWALGRYGTNAFAAAPALQVALGDSQAYVREAASNSLQIIVPIVAIDSAAGTP